LFPAVFFVSCYSATPTSTNISFLSDSIALRKHVTALISPIGFRNYLDTATLNNAADYISQEFSKISKRINIQDYKVEGREYKNIICSFGPEDGERIIIGAHYDVCGNQPGADDNASGIAGLLELVRLLKDTDLKYRIDLVAYTLEEPPFFRSNAMGSYVHAKYLYDNKIPVKGMICLEMIGYFNDNPKSQTYPIGFLSWFYGKTADYILIVQKFSNGSFGRKFNRSVRKAPIIETKFLRSPKFLAGVDFSDHRNYWKFGYDALMITNTSFYRNQNYHLEGDSVETLDFKRMACVVDETFLAVVNLTK